MIPLKKALEQIKRDSVSEKWQFLVHSTDEAISALSDGSIFMVLPKYKLREIILAPIQVSLESANAKLNSDALTALEAFVDSDILYDSLDDPIKDTDLTFQFLDTISPCTIFSDAIQNYFLKLLLKLCLSKYSRLDVNCILRIVQICTDLNSKYILTRNNEKSAIAETTLVQAIEAFVTKNCALRGNVATNMDFMSTPKSAYTILSCYDPAESGLTESQLRILGALTCLIDALMPENITQSQAVMYLHAIKTVVSFLPVSIIKYREFLNILWQRMCPMLMRFLSNPKEEKNITSTSERKNGADHQIHGMASSIAPPTLWADGLKPVYDIVIDLAYLVGPVRELRPMLESLFHKMLLYPPPNYRQNALTTVCRLFKTIEGLLSITGPLISMPMLSNYNAEKGKSSIEFMDLQMPDFRIFEIILESVHACSFSKDQALVCVSAKCVNSIVTTLSSLRDCGNLEDVLTRFVWLQFEQADDAGIVEDKRDNRKKSTENEIPNASLPRTLEVDRWAAHDYLLSLMKTVPSLLDAKSINEVDNLLLEFSSGYCEERRSTVLGGVLSPTDTSDLANDAYIYDVNGTLLNADAVYVATISALALNYRLLQGNFYVNPDKTATEVISEGQFLESILGAGLMIYVSETWLSQVYRGIRHQDLLIVAGLAPELLRGPPVRNEDRSLRGAYLVEMLVDFDGIGWTYVESVEQIGEISNRRVEDKSEKGSQLQKEELSRRAGELLATRILLTGWQRIVETLTNTITLNGVPMKSNVSFSPLKSFAGCRPSTCSTFYINSASPSLEENESARLLGSLYGLFRLNETEIITQTHQTQELSKTLSASLRSLQQLALLASKSSSEKLHTSCGTIFALLTETARAAATTAHPLPSNRLHSILVLNIHIVLSNALRLGCKSRDCWLHLLNACQLVCDLKHVYITSLEHSEPSNLEKSRDIWDRECDISETVERISAANTSINDCLTVEQTGILLDALSTQVDRIFDTAAELLSLPLLIDFLFLLLQASRAELKTRRRPQLFFLERIKGSHLKQTVFSLKDAILNVAMRKIARLHRNVTFDEHINMRKSPSPTIFLDRLSQVLSRVIRSPKRPLLHLLRSWTLVSQHLVDTCCSFSYYDSAPFELEAERLLISQRALACLQECTIMSVTTRLELPYFNANEMFCKPFDSLLRLEMCDGELQDRIISCICEVVQRCNSALHSGWRSIFAALRSIKVPFLKEMDPLTDQPLSDSPTDVAHDESQDRILLPSKIDFGAKMLSTQKIPKRRRISKIMEIFEIFLFTDDVLVFCNIATDCVRCLLCYLSANDLDYASTHLQLSPKISESRCDKGVGEVEGSLNEQTLAAGGTKFSKVDSCALCKSTLFLLGRCCEIFGYIWGSYASGPTNSSFPMDYVLRSAKRQVHLLSGGPPQLSLLPNVQDFISPILRDRCRNLSSWFTTSDHFFEPTFHSGSTFDPGLYTLRSLDDIDQPSGVLNLWFLTLEGIAMAIWDSNPQICRVIFENFNGLLVECAEKICGEVDIPISRLSNAIERVEIEAKQVAVGPSFTVFVVNHVLLPRLQVAVTSNAFTGSMNNNTEMDESDFSHAFSPEHEEAVLVREADGDEVIISKLSFIMGQTTQLVCNLISRFQKKDGVSSSKVVGINLMLHQCMRALVDCISVQNERLSRLATSCLRHLILSTASCLTVHQWEIAIAHLEEGFRASLFAIHAVTVVHTERAMRYPSSDTGLQLANLLPIGSSNRLRQLALRLFQSDDAAEAATTNDKHNDDYEESGKLSYSFEFRIFPLCAHETDRPPLDVIPLCGIVSGLLNTRLLIHLVGEFLLGSGGNKNSIPRNVQKLLCGPCPHDRHLSPQEPATGFTTSDFFTRVPLPSGLRLLNCLTACYSAFFDFEQCDDLKRLIQKLLKLRSPANLYQISYLTVMVLITTLQQTIQNGLAANFYTQLSETVSSTFCEFDSNISKLRINNFRLLPLQLQTNSTKGEFISPLPWLKPLLPDPNSDRKMEQFTVFLAGLSTYLTQFYLFLMQDKHLSHSAFNGPSTSRGAVYPEFSTAEANEEKNSLGAISRRDSKCLKLLNSPQHCSIDAASSTKVDNPERGIVGGCLTKDEASQITLLAESLTSFPDGFLHLSLEAETSLNPASNTIFALESIFTSNVARLIAVAEHAPLRKALATWFLRLIQNQKVSH